MYAATFRAIISSVASGVFARHGGFESKLLLFYVLESISKLYAVSFELSIHLLTVKIASFLCTRINLQIVRGRF